MTASFCAVGTPLESFCAVVSSDTPEFSASWDRGTLWFLSSAAVDRERNFSPSRAVPAPDSSRFVPWLQFVVRVSSSRNGHFSLRRIVSSLLLVHPRPMVLVSF